MFCQECGALMSDGQTFCDDCSGRITKAGVGHPEPFAAGAEILPRPAEAPQQQYFAPGDAFAPPPRGPNELPPGIAECQQQSQFDYRYTRPPIAVEARAARALTYRNSLIAAAISGACGLLVFVSTFLPWISFGGLFNASGWSYMNNSSELGGNFLWYSGPGYLFFTGFFSMLVGLAVIAGAALFLFRSMALGARTAQVAGGLGALLALINLITIYSRIGGSAIGIWVFLLFSIGAAISGELCGSR